MSEEKREPNSRLVTMEPHSMEPISLSPAQGNFHQPVFLASHQTGRPTPLQAQICFGALFG